MEQNRIEERTQKGMLTKTKQNKTKQTASHIKLGRKGK